jgi:mono/diheme cytochrome c family protein
MPFGGIPLSNTQIELIREWILQGALQDVTADVASFAQAELGLSLSPVPLNLDGKTDREINQVGRGSYLVNAIADCGGCHTPVMFNPKIGAPAPDFSRYLAGHVDGAVGASAFKLPFATVYARNLTPDPTTGFTDTEEEFIEMLRTGIDHELKEDTGVDAQLIGMPWETYRWMSDDDLKAIYAFLKVIPPVTNTVPEDEKPAIPSVPFPADRIAGARSDAERGRAITPVTLNTAGLSPQQLTSVGRGSYLVNAGSGCGGCHTSPPFVEGTVEPNADRFLAGGEEFDLGFVKSHSSNLTPDRETGLRMTVDQFIQTIKQGKHQQGPNEGRDLLPPMPWQVYKNMIDQDLQDMYAYLQTIPAINNMVEDVHPDITAVETSTPQRLPETYALKQNVPNPFNPQTTIAWQVPSDGRVTLSVYNTLGQLVRTLVSGNVKAGSYSTVWDGRDNTGRVVAGGIYLYTLEAGRYSETRRMTLLK